MKIILAHKYFYPRDGTTTHVFDLMDLLTSHGHTVIPFAMKDQKNVFSPFSKFFVSEKDFTTPKSILEKVRLFGHMVYSFEAKKKFKKLLRQERPDIVHIHNIYHHISPSILDVCKKTNIPVVQTVHDYKLVCPNYKLFSHGVIDEECLKGNYFHDAWNRSVKNSILAGLACAIEMIIHRALGLYAKRVQHWIVPSKCVEEILVRGGYPQERISVIHHFVREENQPGALNYETPSSGTSLSETDIFLLKNSSYSCQQSVGSDRDIPRRELRNSESGGVHANASGPYLLCVGRLSEEKGFAVAIAALQHLAMPLVIAGEGPARASLEHHAVASGVSDRVHFVGFQSRQQLRELMTSAVAVLVPSLWDEPFCYVVPESFFAHTVPIGSDTGALKEFLGSISQKLIFPHGDSIALADRASELLNDSLLRKNLIEKGISYYKQHCSAESYYDSLMNVYNNAIRELNT